jgi:hypothetical protein
MKNFGNYHKFSMKMSLIYQMLEKMKKKELSELKNFNENPNFNVELEFNIVTM